MQDIRWKQRFQSFEKSLHLLNSSLEHNNPDVFHKAGIIQFYEITFDLSWKLLKDWLEEQGYSNLNAPKSVLKKASKST